MIILRDATEDGGAGLFIWNDLNNVKWTWAVEIGMSGVSVDHIH
jgi:hypothetical protein